MKIVLSGILQCLFLALILFSQSCKNDSVKEIPTPNCDTSNVTFSGDVFPIIQNSCLSGCHSGSSPSAGITLSTYAGVKAKVTDNRLYGSITHASGFSAMPKGGSKLTDCNLSKIKAWIDAGAPNN
jgi:hypothetical protein